MITATYALEPIIGKVPKIFYFTLFDLKSNIIEYTLV